MKELLKKLSETYGPSGSEGAVRDLILGEIRAAGVMKRAGADIRTDAMGNLIVRVPGKAKGRRVMLAAHMDEIGIVVTYIDEKGFLRFGGIGGIRPLSLVGGRVLFADGAIGVIGAERLEDSTKIPTLDQLYLDVGASSRSSCPVKIGDTACFQRSFYEAGNRIVGKAMDDRIGCAILLRIMARLTDSPHDVSFVFTVQEEVGSRGAMTSGYGIDPEIAVAVDVTATGDTPECRPMAMSLGSGPAVKVKDSGMLSHPGVKGWLAKTAENSKIPYQLEVLEGGTTDARVIQTARAGVPAGCLSIPCRYVHTPSETVDYRDVLAASELLIAALGTDIEDVPRN